MNHKEGIYKRSKKKLGIEVFSHKMRDFLEQKKVFVYHMLGRNITNRFQWNGRWKSAVLPAMAIFGQKGNF